MLHASKATTIEESGEIEHAFQIVKKTEWIAFEKEKEVIVLRVSNIHGTPTVSYFS